MLPPYKLCGKIFGDPTHCNSKALYLFNDTCVYFIGAMKQLDNNRKMTDEHMLKIDLIWLICRLLDGCQYNEEYEEQEDGSLTVLETVVERLKDFSHKRLEVHPSIFAEFISKLKQQVSDKQH